MTFATVAVAALALVGPAAARPRRSSRTTPPAPTHTVDSGNVYENSHSSSTSTASCSAEVKASTWSTAVSGFTDLISEMTLDFCKARRYHNKDVERKQLDLQIKAVAELLLESKLKCDAEGKYAVACAASWAGAHSFAAAAMEAYASAWADGSNGLDKCKCAVNVFAEADAVTSAWAEIWVSIYQGLDDSVCAQTYDGTKDSIKKDINIHCVGNLVLNYWVKAIATVISKGKCEPKEYLVCEACCKDSYGDYILDCNVDDCKNKCRKFERAELYASAEAAISFNEKKRAVCNADVTVDYETYWYKFKPAEFDTKTYGAEDADAYCEAEAYAESYAESASAQAVRIKGIWQNTCNPYSWVATGHKDFDKETHAWAEAYIDILVDAYTYCEANGGDPEYDGGCARATSHSKAYASAMAEAFAHTFINFSYGKKDSCKCDIGVSVLASNIAHELEIISAFYETAVEARTCNKDNYGSPDFSYIQQSCWAHSLADMVAKSMASVSLEGKCAPSGSDKVEYCKGQCQEFDTGDDEWDVCLAECEKESSAKITAALEAVAKIEVNSEEYCDGNDYLRTGETYLTKLNGFTTSPI